jgi:hypothetical protein
MNARVPRVPDKMRDKLEYQEEAEKLEKPKRGRGVVCKQGVGGQILAKALRSDSRTERDRGASAWSRRVLGAKGRIRGQHS